MKPAPYKNPTGTSSKKASPAHQLSSSAKTPTGTHTSNKPATPAQQTSVSNKTPTGIHTSSKPATPAQQASVSNKTSTGIHTSSKPATPAQQTSVSDKTPTVIHTSSKPATPAQQASVSNKTSTGIHTSSKPAIPAQQTSVSNKTSTGIHTSSKPAIPAQQTSVTNKTPTGIHTSTKPATPAQQASVSNKTSTGIHTSSKPATPAQQTSVSDKTPTGIHTSSKPATPAQQASVFNKTSTGIHTSSKPAIPAQQTSVSNKTSTGIHTSSKPATPAQQTSVSDKTPTGTSRNPASTTATGLKQPNLQTAMVNPPTLAASQTSTNDDHSYSDSIPPKRRRLDPAVLPAPVAAILPQGYKYKCMEFEDLPEMMQDGFRVRFCIKDVTCKEEVDNWMTKLASSSNIKYNTESGGRTRTGKRVSFARWYICQCKRKKLTKKQDAAKRKAQLKKQLQRQSHPMNNESEQLDLLSKNRDKKTDCDSKMSVKIFTKRATDEMCEVELWWNHNHSVNSFHLQSFCPILSSTKVAFESYFERGMSASEAFHHHETKLMQDSISIMLLADRKYCPSLTDVRNMYAKWQIDNKGAPNGEGMFCTLATIIDDYNKNNACKGGECFLQTYEQSGKCEQPLIIAICTPLMSRVHHLKQAGEMAFLDASGSLDRFNNPVYFMCTHHPAGALPLGVWITSGQSQHIAKQCLQKLQNLLPPHAFGGRGPKTRPQIFMTDDDSGQRGALSDIWKESILLLCTFHFLQAVWRWLFNANNNINKEDRLMQHFQKLVF